LLQPHPPHYKNHKSKSNTRISTSAPMSTISASMSSSENVCPKILHTLQRQIQRFKEEKIYGIRLVQKETDDLSNVTVEMAGPEDTPYVGGTFALTLSFPANFPNSPPKAVFTTSIFHPNISTTGEVCVSTLKRDWDPNNWSLEHIVKVIRCLLIVPFPESALNPEAARLFMESYTDFAAHARLITSVHAVRRPRDKTEAIPNATSDPKSRSSKRAWKRL